MSKHRHLKPVEYDNLSAKAQGKINWTGRLILPKWDGCFMMVGFIAGELAFMLSRTGEDYRTSMGHVEQALRERYPTLIHNAEPICFLGEAWSPGLEFGEISGAFRRLSPQPHLGYQVFDAVHWRPSTDPAWPILEDARPYRDRLNDLINRATALGMGTYPATLANQGLVGVPLPHIVSSLAAAQEMALHYKSLGGYDGAIASDPAASYRPGSGSAGEFLKLKPLVSFSLLCIGAEVDVGEKTGRPTAALVCRWKDGTTVKVATGLSEAEQADPGQFTDKVIEVEAMGVHPDKDGKPGKLREPRYKGLRLDADADFYAEGDYRG